MNEIKITYIANAGILITGAGKKILIDGIHSFEPFGFSPVPATVLNHIIAGQGIYEDIDYLLFTHCHKDHLNMHKLTDYCLLNTPQMLVLPKDGSSLENITGNITFLDMELWAEKVIHEEHDLKLIAYKTIHDGKEYRDVDHYVYQINLLERHILVMGDTDFRRLELEPLLASQSIDILIVNWLFLNNRIGRAFINKVNPQQLLIYHLPFENEDSYNYIKIAQSDLKRYESEMPKTKLLLSCEEFIRV
ncbi:MBL fold metallo-hydrolase [Acetobacterium sp.]|uniref:MBL fold metallo-hydrolase n=1 Tax=Acetobacterium sp. TaxID=1872094 RepID=UPI0035933FBA